MVVGSTASAGQAVVEPSQFSATSQTPTVSPPAGPDDFAAIDAALARMIDAENEEGLTSPLGEDAADVEWSGLDNLELEDLFPAKQRDR